jgi:pimeloyl-ACP methyl ester carboxylesterase
LSAIHGAARWALSFALHHPHEAAGLMLLAPAAYQDGGSLLSAVMQTPMLGDIFTTISDPIIGRRFLRSNLERAFHPDPPPDGYLATAQNFWLRRAQSRAYAQNDHSLNASLRRLSERYHQIRLPVEIVTGDSDLIVPAEAHAYPLHRAIKHSRLTVLSWTGHQIPHTRPADLVQAIDDSAWQRITR